MESEQDVPLPLANEDIYVYFQMSTSDFIWWKTTIDNITASQPKKIRAAATVTFHEGFDSKGILYKQEKGTLHFIHGNVVTAISHTKSFRQTDTYWRMSGGRHDITDSYSTSPPIRSVRQSEDIDAEYVPSRTSSRKMKRRRTGMNTRQRNNEERAAVEEEEQASDEEAWQETCGSLQRQVHALERKLISIESAIEVQACRNKPCAVKLYMKYELQRFLRRPPTKLLGENNTKFHSILRRCPIQFSVSCTLPEFCQICNDLNLQYQEGIIFLPSLSRIVNHEEPLESKHVVFQKYKNLLTWLGIFDEVATRKCTIQENWKRGVRLVQLVGGAQWDEKNESNPLRIFVGDSCSKRPSLVQEKVMGRSNDRKKELREEQAAAKVASTKCVSLRNGAWDTENAAFVCRFEASTGSNEIRNIGCESIADYDTYGLSWKPLNGLPPREFSFLTDKVVLGKIHVYIPVLILSGSAICGEILSLI